MNSPSWRRADEAGSQMPQPSDTPTPGVALECSRLSKAFGGIRAVDGVTAQFEVGKVTALIGPNGAGKTTLFQLISGTLRPDAGEVRYHGSRISGLSSWEIALGGVGRLFQDVRVFANLSVLENVLVGFRSQTGEKPLAALLARRRIAQEEQKNAIEARRLLEFVGLDSDWRTPAEQLSFGQQKLLAMARLLAAGAGVFLLDEPTAGVSSMLVKRLLGLIRHLVKEGKTVIVIEHNMAVVLDAADWVYFMDEGQIAAFGLPHEVFDDASVQRIYLGL